MRPRYEVADVLRQGITAYQAKHQLSSRQQRIIQDIQDCRTSALGGHVDACDECGYMRISYNSCRNSHCPKCQSMAREEWVEKRQAELLEVKYFHFVFTLPSELHDIIRYNERLLYGQLFKLAWQSLQELVKDKRYLGAESGMIAVLHIPLCRCGTGYGVRICIIILTPCPALRGSLPGSGRWPSWKR